MYNDWKATVKGKENEINNRKTKYKKTELILFCPEKYINIYWNFLKYRILVYRSNGV